MRVEKIQETERWVEVYEARPRGTRGCNISTAMIKRQYKRVGDRGRARG